MQQEDIPSTFLGDGFVGRGHATDNPPAWWRTFVFRVLTGRQLSVLLYLLTCMATQDECSPTTEEIRSFVGLNRPNMVFEALDILDDYGFVVRHRRVLPGLSGRRNLYQRPPWEYTILRLLQLGILDERLRVRHLESSYTPEIMRELDTAARGLLGDRYDEYASSDGGQSKKMLMTALSAKIDGHPHLRSV